MPEFKQHKNMVDIKKKKKRNINIPRKGGTLTMSFSLPNTKRNDI